MATEMLMNAAQSQGLWALLFVTLLAWVFKENSKREAKYQEIISKLTEKFENIEKGLDNLNDKIEGWVKK